MISAAAGGTPLPLQAKSGITISKEELSAALVIGDEAGDKLLPADELVERIITEKGTELTRAQKRSVTQVVREW